MIMFEKLEEGFVEIGLRMFSADHWKVPVGLARATNLISIE
jgi:hypothetical protein